MPALRPVRQVGECVDPGSRMEIPFLIVGGVVVALIFIAARPGARTPRRSADGPRLWDRAPGTEHAALFGLMPDGDSHHSHHVSEQSHYDLGHDSSTNSPADFGGEGGGTGGGGDG